MPEKNNDFLIHGITWWANFLEYENTELISFFDLIKHRLKVALTTGPPNLSPAKKCIEKIIKGQIEILWGAAYRNALKNLS